jgi:hypothetical protein
MIETIDVNHMTETIDQAHMINTDLQEKIPTIRKETIRKIEIETIQKTEDLRPTVVVHPTITMARIGAKAPDTDMKGMIKEGISKFLSIQMITFVTDARST